MFWSRRSPGARLAIASGSHPARSYCTRGSPWPVPWLRSAQPGCRRALPTPGCAGRTPTVRAASAPTASGAIRLSPTATPLSMLHTSPRTTDPGLLAPPAGGKRRRREAGHSARRPGRNSLPNGQRMPQVQPCLFHPALPIPRPDAELAILHRSANAEPVTSNSAESAIGIRGGMLVSTRSNRPRGQGGVHLALMAGGWAAFVVW